MTDKAHWGVVDRWDFPDDGYGDCEDYQLLKRKLLRERGLPQRAMRMTVVIDELNEGPRGADDPHRPRRLHPRQQDQCRPAWDQTGYVYVKREGQDRWPGPRSAA